MILVINGPNLNLLGQREPDIYGSASLSDLEAACKTWGNELGIKVECRQTNHEGDILEWLHAAQNEGITGIILNAGAYTHTSVALHDAISGITVPVIEVHLSNIHARESFRHHSLIAAACLGSIAGLGFASYRAALHFFAEQIA